MKYDLTRPCDKCPFRTDLEPYLRPARVTEIARSLVRSEFPCHMTTGDMDEEDGDPTTPDDEQHHCAGALILLEKTEKPSQMMRICERVGLYDASKLDMKAPVYDSFGKMLAATTAAQRRRDARLRKKKKK